MKLLAVTEEYKDSYEENENKLQEYRQLVQKLNIEKEQYGQVIINSESVKKRLEDKLE